MRGEVRIVELDKTQVTPPRLQYRYMTDGHYALRISRNSSSWQMELALQRSPKPLEKRFWGGLFEEFVEEPRVFAAEIEGRQVGWMELGYHKWNNRMRIWQFLVEEESRRKGIGSKLLGRALAVAREKSARMLVLETQSCNIPAIEFYLRHGFELVGFDSSAYSNEDVEKGEIRLEFGLPL